MEKKIALMPGDGMARRWRRKRSRFSRHWNATACGSIAAILSAAMMLDHNFGLPDMAALIEEAVRLVLRASLRAADIAEPGVTIVGCEAMSDAIAAAL